MIYHELEGNQSVKIYEDHKVEVFTIPLNHRLTAMAISLEKPKERHLNMEEIKAS
ncbi:hypothetical protein INT81_04235 [Riemerella anatipestifer]|nr:hypothetical protein [Riemerella anatipestifer]